MEKVCQCLLPIVLQKCERHMLLLPLWNLLRLPLIPTAIVFACGAMEDNLLANLLFFLAFLLHERLKKFPGPSILEYGNFPAPPRDQREVRSGNKTLTFR